MGPGLRLASAALATVLVAGCLNLTRPSVDYAEATTTIEMACENPFEVRENATRRRIEVSSSEAVTELGRTFWKCDDAAVRQLTKGERYHRAAREYLTRTGRKDCEVLGAEVRGLSTYEFRYTCDAERRRGAEKKLHGR